MKRYALLNASDWERHGDAIEALLPGNYRVLALLENGERVIGGTDHAGWTLDGYVLPRLASGLVFGTEIDLSHPALPRRTACSIG